jgi:uncharacterized protein (TIGR02594 family)
MTPHIAIVGADKGGVGKTFLSRVMISYLEKRPQRPVDYEAFDGQHPTGILKRFHPDHTSVVSIRKSDDQVRMFDRLKPNQVKVIDLAAGELVYMLNLVGELGFLEDVNRGAIKLTVFHVIGSTQASFDEIAVVKKLVTGARHFLVTNHINDAQYLGLSDELKAEADGVIDIPQLDSMAADYVDKAGVGFNEFVANDAHSLVLRRKVSAWLAKCFAEYSAAVKNIGRHEIGNNAGPYIGSLIEQAKCGHIGDPWCAIFVNAMLESVGVHGTRSPSSQSFRHDPNFIQLAGPALGAIVVFWRISRASGLGHVAFYDGETDEGFINALGGNESDMVRRELLNPHANTFGLVGYYWPKDQPMPVIGKIVTTRGALGSGKVV